MSFNFVKQLEQAVRTIAGDVHSIGLPLGIGRLGIVKTSRHLVQAPSAFRRIDGPLRAVPSPIIERSEVQTIQRHPPLDLLGSFLDRQLLHIGLSAKAYVPALGEPKQPR